LIPEDLGITLDERIDKNGEKKAGAFQKEPKIKELIDSDPKAARVWEFALKLEGLKRNAGMHAAGVVISNEELWHKAPLYKPSNDNTIVTQYSLNFLEDVDLIKFDFLGLKTLTVIDNALRLIYERHGKTIDFATVDVEDQNIYRYLQKGQSTGLFQIESDGMIQLTKELKPDSFNDLIAILALYRPGPMGSGMHSDYIKRKHKIEQINYFYDEFEAPLKPILEPTYGVIVYQEQVMQIVQTIGGFSLGEADIIRRAMGKKKKEEMDKWKNAFGDGAVKLGYDRNHALELFALIEKFADYGFNKSHSAAYAMITFYTSYLKYYYPAEFMAALLTSEQDNTDKIVRYIDEIKKMNIPLLAPNINISSLEFSVTTHEGKDAIVFGLGAIKGAGESAILPILEARKDGKFVDFGDLIARVEVGKLNKKVIESFAKAGAFDEFGFTRAALLEQVEQVIENISKIKQLKTNAQNSLFFGDEEMNKVYFELNNMPEYEPKKILELEKETLGIYVSGHPLDEFREQIESLNYTLSSEFGNVADGQVALFVGKVESVTEKFSKNGSKFTITKIIDFHGDMEFLTNDKHLKKLNELDFKLPIVFKAKVVDMGESKKVNLQDVMTLDEAKGLKIGTKKEETRQIEEPLVIILDIKADPCLIDNIFNIATSNKGGKKLIVVLEQQNTKIKIDTKIWINQEAINQIKMIEGVRLFA
ncbi:MAG: DNA polymerase III subunit alpha, partial [Epsilonproteobacteria bacterium]|nr:DNA polymerase III subunit alpha [Campylobacterota bacterium]